MKIRLLQAPQSAKVSLHAGKKIREVAARTRTHAKTLQGERLNHSATPPEIDVRLFKVYL